MLPTTAPECPAAPKNSPDAPANNQDGHFREQGYFIGSGVVEAGCKAIIGRRLKQSGMFWSEDGAENILQLRCLIKSPHFDAAWQARRPILEARQTKKRRWSQAS